MALAITDPLGLTVTATKRGAIRVGVRAAVVAGQDVRLYANRGDQGARVIVVKGEMKR